ncbi:MAG: transglycosylase SLT domain-containing protein [Proteobacteria bacterium]|nr:transglycosylase SLT domain-containing protein [Pseudomonadota bacterium]
MRLSFFLLAALLGLATLGVGAVGLRWRAIVHQQQAGPASGAAPSRLARSARAARPSPAQAAPLPPEQRASTRQVFSARKRQAAIFLETQHGPFDDLILAAALRWKLDPFLLKGLLDNESELDPSRMSKRSYATHGGRRLLVSGGALGIAQFTAAGVRGVNRLRARRRRRGARVLFFDLDRARISEEAIPAAAELLAHLINRYGRDGGITAYNAGGVGGRAVSRLGFWRARHAGRLRRSGLIRLQGDRFLLNVLARSSWYREGAGLDRLYEPDILHPSSQRYVSAAPPSPGTSALASARAPSATTPTAPIAIADGLGG